MAAPRGSARLRVMPRLERFTQLNAGAASHGGAAPLPEPAPRQPSSRCTDSTLITAAPRSAANCVTIGPAMNIDRSRMRIPASGACCVTNASLRSYHAGPPELLQAGGGDAGDALQHLRRVLTEEWRPR